MQDGLQLKRRASDRSFSGPICARIKHARRLCGLTQAGLAKRLGIGASAVAQWEIPNGTSPTAEHLAEVARTCGVAFEWIATGRGRVSCEAEEAPAIVTDTIALDESEEELLRLFRRLNKRARRAALKIVETLKI